MINKNYVFLGSLSCLLLAIIYQQYSSSLTTSPIGINFNDDNADLSACDAKLMQIRSNSEFPSWLKKFVIFVDGRIIDEQENISKEIEKCHKAFKQVINESSYLPNLVSRDLKIMLLPAEILDGSYAVYAPETSTIGIRYRRGTPIYQYKRFLRNEFFSHQVQTRNNLLGVKTKDINKSSLLFMNQDLSINEEKLTKFEAALNKSKQKLEHCKEYFLNYSQDKNNPCEKLMALSEHYHPNLYYLSQEQYDITLKYKIVTPLDSNNKFTSGERLPKDSPRCYGYKKYDEFVYSYAKDNSSLAKTTALIFDLLAHFEALDNPLSPYANLTRVHRLSEMASFLAEYPKDVQKFFFADACNLLCEFFTCDTNKLQPAYLPTTKDLNPQPNIVKENKDRMFFKEPKPPQNNVASKQKHSATNKPVSTKNYHFGAR